MKVIKYHRNLKPNEKITANKQTMRDIRTAIQKETEFANQAMNNFIYLLEETVVYSDTANVLLPAIRKAFENRRDMITIDLKNVPDPGDREVIRDTKRDIFRRLALKYGIKGLNVKEG